MYYKLKGKEQEPQEAKGKLEGEKPNAMCSHKIKIEDIKDIDNEVLGWIKTAYESAK